MKKLQPFQFIGAKQAYEAGRFLIADDMGMFKTSQSILVNNLVRAERKGLHTLVVCPTSVRPHWIKEIQEWAYPRGQSVQVVNADTLRGDLVAGTNADWTIIHYPLLSRMNGEDLSQMVRTGYKHVILDEVHNAKNPKSLRSKAVKKLTDQTEFLTALSGTPIPNTVQDIYMLMHLLDPEKYPLTQDVNIDAEARQRFLSLYWERPQEFKELIHRKMISRKPVDVGMESSLPELEIENAPIEMTGKWKELYDAVLDESLHFGKKIMTLEKILIDPSLVAREFGFDFDSSPKYEMLDKLIEEESARGGKTLVFTNLKRGVVQPLLERYSEHGAIAITGDVSATAHNVREDLRQRFQRDPNTEVLFATTTMNEGVDLTAATQIVNLSLPWDPASYWQRIKRVHRMGEVHNPRVVVCNLIAEYPSTIRKSLDQARFEMLEAKQKVARYLQSAMAVSREELLEMQEPGKIPRIRKAIKSDGEIVFQYYLGWRGIGTAGALRRARQEKRAQDIAERYPNFSMTKNSARLYLPVVEELCPEDPWLDLAGGPGMLGHHAKRKVHVVDISHAMLKKGQRLETGYHVQGSFSSIPYKSRSFGFVNCSLAFQMSEPTQERSRVLMEMNRVLKPEAYAVVTLPTGYITPEERMNFEMALRDYGFRNLEKYHGVDLGPSKIEMYVLQKDGECSREKRDMTWYGDRVKEIKPREQKRKERLIGGNEDASC